MPFRVRRACPKQPCPNYQPCPTHGDAQPYRGSATQRGYGAQWAARRRYIIASRGNRCEECGQPGYQDDPLDVDHVISRRKGGTDDPSNLKVLHHSEHSRKTALVDGGWGNAPKPPPDVVSG